MQKLGRPIKWQQEAHFLGIPYVKSILDTNVMNLLAYNFPSIVEILWHQYLQSTVKFISQSPNRDVSRNVYVRLVCEDLVPVKRLKDEGEKLPPYVVILRCMEIL